MKKTIKLSSALFLLLIFGLVFYTFIQPELNKKTSNEQLMDIVKMEPDSNSPPAEAAVPPAQPETMMTAPVVPPSGPTATIPKPPPPPPPPPAPAPATPKVLRTGQFRGVQGEKVSGGGSIVQHEGKNFLRLEGDFQSNAGPDLYVGFGDNDKPDKNTLFSRLKATSGGQNYEIPSSIDPSKYSQIFVHCKIYNHTFGVADLR